MSEITPGPTEMRKFTKSRGITFEMLNTAREYCSKGIVISEEFAQQLGAPSGKWVVSSVEMSADLYNCEIELIAGGWWDT